MKQIILLSVILCLTFPLTIFSQDDWFIVDEYSEIGENYEYHHHIGLFLGAMSNLQNSEIAFSSGIDYTYSFSNLYPVIKLGGFVEGGFGKHTEAIIGGIVQIKPWEEASFLIAPSILYQDLHSTDIDEIHSTSKVKFLLRFGGSFSFHINNFSISPTINADIVGSRVSLIYGLGFGVGI